MTLETAASLLPKLSHNVHQVNTAIGFVDSIFTEARVQAESPSVGMIRDVHSRIFKGSSPELCHPNDSSVTSM